MDKRLGTYGKRLIGVGAKREYTQLQIPSHVQRVMGWRSNQLVLLTVMQDPEGRHYLRLDTAGPEELQEMIEHSVKTNNIRGINALMKDMDISERPPTEPTFRKGDNRVQLNPWDQCNPCEDNAHERCAHNQMLRIRGQEIRGWCGCYENHHKGPKDPPPEIMERAWKQ